MNYSNVLMSELCCVGSSLAKELSSEAGDEGVETTQLEEPVHKQRTGAVKPHTQHRPVNAIRGQGGSGWRGDWFCSDPL